MDVGAQQGSFLGEARERVTLADIEGWIGGADAPAAWVEEYLFLRAKGIAYKQAMLAVWLSLGKDDRGTITTRQALADLLGVTRRTTYDWEAEHPEIQEYAELLLVRRMRGEKLAEVDQRTYAAAVADTGSHNDRKLFYQRAGVWDENPAGEETAEIRIVLDGPRGT